MRELNQHEKSLLLYLETCAVDHGGLIVGAQMNDKDDQIAHEWEGCGFIQFGRIAMKDIQKGGQFPHTHWCVLSEEAWGLAHKERRVRAARITEKVPVTRLGWGEHE